MPSSTWEPIGCIQKPPLQGSKRAVPVSYTHLDVYKRQAQLQADAAAEAEERFKAASNCTSHPYLIHKGVKAYGIKTESDGTLLIPMRDSGILCNVERIDSSDFANKKGLFGGRRAGCCLLYTSRRV